MAQNTNSISFNASGTSNQQYLTTPTQAVYAPANYTVEFWIKPTTLGVSNFVLGKDGAGARQFVFGIIASNKLYAEHNGATNLSASSSGTVDANNWHHCAIVNQNGTCTAMYIDLVAQTVTGSVGTALINGNEPLNIGRRAQSADFGYFNGLIDEVRFWNTNLPSGSISARWKTVLVGTETNLIGYWPMDEGTGAVTLDKTSNNGTMTFTNSPTWSSDIPFTVTSGAWLGKYIGA